MVDLKEAIRELEKLRGKFYLAYPSYINHIRFPRFKNMATDSRIDFSFPITALVGSNGSGKTSVLNALYGAPWNMSTGDYWFSTMVDPIQEGDGSPNRFIYGHYNASVKQIVETRKARVRKVRQGRADPNYWEPTKEAPGDGMIVPTLGKKTIAGRSLDRWNPVRRKVLYINFRKELSAFDKYFYFGKDPSIDAAKAINAAKKAGKPVRQRRFTSKQDRVRNDATLLARVIESRNTSVLLRNRKIAIENRLLNSGELKMVSFVLGREYTEARWIKHRLFQGEEGLSIVFRTKHGRYSEAFAGSGEVAVTSCVVQVMKASKGTLLLLDEPEVSLHPGAQERLLAFLALMTKQKKMQVVFSTHSPHLISALPHDAIKTFYQLSDGAFAVIPETHPYTAFSHLGDIRGNGIQVIVEDPLAKSIVQQALLLIEDKAVRPLFRIEYVQGGAASILAKRIPVLMEQRGHFLILLDGDQRKAFPIRNPDDIPESEDAMLADVIEDQVGVKPTLLIDGGASGGNANQKARFYRRYLKWVSENLEYIPGSCPEELIVKVSNQDKYQPNQTSQFYKDRLRAQVIERMGDEASNEETDKFGEIILATNRENIPELIELRDKLLKYLKQISG